MNSRSTFALTWITLIALSMSTQAIGQTISLTSPNGGEEWARWSTHEITWDTGELGGDIKILLRKGFGSYATISASTPNDGNYSWTIPGNYDVYDNYRMYIGHLEDGTRYDYSDSAWSIVEGISISLTSPNGGERWARWSTHEITWDTGELGGDIKILLKKGFGSYATISASTPNDGNYSWTIPGNYDVYDDYRMYIGHLEDDTRYDYSDSAWSIVEETKVIDNASCAPTAFQLYQNFPNPFNTETTIKYCLPAPRKVKVEVYNTLQQVVTVLVDSEMKAGSHQITWDGDNMASGVYFCRLQAGAFRATKRMVLLK